MEVTFTQKVYAVVRRIPKGSVLTYGQVAQRAGRPLATRAVGMILSRNKDKSVPCHRVIRSDGRLGGYNGLRGEKERLLRREKAIL